MLIEVAMSGDRIDRVSVTGHRPALVSHLRGQPARVAEQTLPLLYAVCARAHAAAASAALNAARGGTPTTIVDLNVAAEAAREQLLAVLTGPAKSWLPRAVQSIATPGALRDLFNETLLGMAVEDWLDLGSLADVQRWASTSSSVLAEEFRRRFELPEPAVADVAVLPLVDAAASLHWWPTLNEAFGVTPEIQGNAAQTGAICRESHQPVVRELQARPLLQRWLARVRDLARYSYGDPASVVGRVSSVRAGERRGRSIVETARGMLMHEVELTDDLVTDDVVVDYAIVAPTQWNLHPDGAVRRWLDGLRVASDAEALALTRRVVEALDPCVEWRCVIVRGQV